jgi:hypothetical protein
VGGRLAKQTESRLTGAQLRAARGLLGLTPAELAEETKLGERTVRRAEKENGVVRLTPVNEARLVSVLQELGVQFIAENGGGAGVRLIDTSLAKARRATAKRKTSRRSKSK